MPRRTAAQDMTPDALARLINQRYPGAITMASDPGLEIERISTGMLSLDVMLGGGWARGRHVEIFGGYAVGKTYCTYKTIASAQAEGLRCAFIDVEGTFDPSFASMVGVDLEELAFPQRGQHANRLIDIMETLLRSELYDVIVLDSIAALLPKSEQEADMEAGSYGTAQARLMSAALRRLTTANKRTVLIYINQTREAIGVMFGKRSITSGGKAMGFYAGTRVEMVRTEGIKRSARKVNQKTGADVTEKVLMGHRVLVRLEKDKTGARPYSETTFVFNYDIGGVDPIEDLLYLGRVFGLIRVSSSGKWWVEGYEDEKVAGRARMKGWLRRNVAVAEELEESIRSKAAEEPLEDAEVLPDEENA